MPIHVLFPTGKHSTARLPSGIRMRPLVHSRSVELRPGSAHPFRSPSYFSYFWSPPRSGRRAGRGGSEVGGARDRDGGASTLTGRSGKRRRRRGPPRGSRPRFLGSLQPRCPTVRAGSGWSAHPRPGAGKEGGEFSGRAAFEYLGSRAGAGGRTHRRPGSPRSP